MALLSEGHWGEWRVRSGSGRGHREARSDRHGQPRLSAIVYLPEAATAPTLPFPVGGASCASFLW